MLGHEVDGVGRRHLRGDDEVALVLAILGIDQDDHAPVAQLLDDVVDGRQKALALGVGGRGLELVVHLRNSISAGDVAREQVDLQVNAVAGLFAPQRRVRQGMWDDIDAKARSRHLVDRQRDAVEGDRALGGDKAAPAPADSNEKRRLPRPARCSTMRPRPSTCRARCGRPARRRRFSARSRLTGRPGRQSPSVVLGQRLVGDIDREQAAAARWRDGRDGKTAAVTGDRAADGDQLPGSRVRMV